MKLWTVQYVDTSKAETSVTEWLPGKPAATNRAIELDCPVTVRERSLPDNREDMAQWLNDEKVAPWIAPKA